MDKFEQFETAISNWIHRHKIIILFIIGIFLLLTITTSTILLFSGSVGMSMVIQNITERHDATIISSDLYVSEKTWATYNNIIIPVFMFTLDYIGCLNLVLGIAYFAAVGYLLFRVLYRKMYRERGK